METDTQTLRIFLTLAHEKNLTRSAKQLGMAKSSVSRAISRLEEALGVSLFQRSSRLVTLTDAGARYVAHARGALDALAAGQAELAATNGVSRGTVRITAPPDLARSLLLEPLEAIRRAHPALHVELVLTGRVVNMLEERIDLALRVGPLADSALRSLPVGPALEFWPVASPDYVARAPRIDGPRSLASLDILLVRAKAGRATWRLSDGLRDHSIEVTGTLVANDHEFLLDAAVRGLGVALLPARLCAPEIDRGTLLRVCAPFALRLPRVHLLWVHHARPDKVLVTIRHLLAKALDLDAWTSASTAPRRRASRPSI